MTTEQMDDKDAQRAGFKDAADQRGDGRGRWPFTPNPADSVKPDPMGGASLADRLRAMGAVRVTTTTIHGEDPVEWVNAPLEVVVEQAELAVKAVDHDEDTLRKVSVALSQLGLGVKTVESAITSILNAGILFRERMSEPTPEDHTHHTREARDQCAAGDHQYAKLLDDAAERERIAAHDQKEGRPHLAEAIRELIDRPQGEAVAVSPEDYVTMAEEPIENRLRRAWLNGFRDGVERASYATTESTGRWDY